MIFWSILLKTVCRHQQEKLMRVFSLLYSIKEEMTYEILTIRPVILKGGLRSIQAIELQDSRKTTIVYLNNTND